MSVPHYDREGMARMIRMEFKRKKEEITRHKYKPNPRHDHWENWLAAADNCIKVGADPIRYVEACFIGCRSPSGPFANQLGGPGAERWWQFSHPRREVEEVPDEADIETNAAELVRFEVTAVAKMLIRMTRSANPADWRELLITDATPIPSYVRIALGHWIPGVPEIHAESALRTLTTNPEIVTALKNLGYDLTDFINHHGRTR